jgi:endonuclease YncB( thermonuclease family)
MRLSRPVTALLLVFSVCAQAAHTPFAASVTGVSDGDTITVLDSNQIPHKIRLAGIDAPEKGQPFGERAKQRLSELVFKQVVHIDWSKMDKYGRMVAVVRVPAPGTCDSVPCSATMDVNLAQIAAGFAWHYKQYESEQTKHDRLAYGIAEQHAREQKLGLWRDTDPVPPWEWRHGLAEGPVKKSRNEICHGPDMPTYRSVKNFTAYQTLDECIASGGRLPKPPGG